MPYSKYNLVNNLHIRAFLKIEIQEVDLSTPKIDPFLFFSRSVSASSASSEELRQQIRKHKATRPAIDLEAEKASKDNSQEPTDGNFILYFFMDCFEF